MPDLTWFDDFVKAELSDATGPVKSRLMTAIALIERLREDATFNLEHHKRGVSNGIKSQNTYAKAAIERLGLKGQFGEYGRRSNDLDVWGPKLMRLLEVAWDATTADSDRSPLLDDLHRHLAQLWRRHIFSVEPLRPNYALGTAAAVIADLLEQATEHGTGPRFAQAIIGAKLEIRLVMTLEIQGANEPDRSARGRQDDRAADFMIEDAAIEVTLGLPDHKHRKQIGRIVREWKKEAWLLVRDSDVHVWRDAVSDDLGHEAGMAVVLGLESYVGQNIAERSGFARPATQDELRTLFSHYNMRWASPMQSPLIILG